MRIALLSYSNRAGDDPDLPLGALALAGRSLAERQLDLAIGLGCMRVICLADGLDAELIELQHRAEKHGGKFHVISGARPLAGLVGSADELVVIADGLLPAATEAREILEIGPGVLVLPVESGVSAGFERIDLNHAWAGVLAMPGRLVEHLTELPADCDTISSLLRIALQGRVVERALPPAVLAEGRWAILKSREQLDELEPDWFRRHAEKVSIFAPGRAAARLAVRIFGSSFLSRGWKPQLMGWLGMALAGLGVAASAFDQLPAALLICGLGWLICEAASSLTSIMRAGLEGDMRSGKTEILADWLIDGCLVAILIFALVGPAQERVFAPLILIGLSRLAGRAIAASWAESFQDRSLLVLILIISGVAGVLLPAIELLSLVYLALILGFSRRIPQLTQA